MFCLGPTSQVPGLWHPRPLLECTWFDALWVPLWNCFAFIKTDLRSCFCWEALTSSLGPTNVQWVARRRRKAWCPCLHFKFDCALSWSLCSHLAPSWNPGRIGLIITSCDKTRNCPPDNNGFLIVTRCHLTTWDNDRPTHTSAQDWLIIRGLFANYADFSPPPQFFL